MSSDSEQAEANKRAAFAGQWRTPPMQVYPAGYSQPAPAAGPPAPPQPMQQSHAPQPPPPGQSYQQLPEPTSIPNNSEDYAKALQEAYRKGAEAAARMAQQQQIPTAASCPNFTTGPHAAPPPPPPPQQPMGITAEEAAYSHQVHPPPAPTHATIPDPLSSSMPPPPPPPVHHHPPPSMAAPQVDYAPPRTHLPPKASQGQRSLSLPDMSAYAAQAEEEKRQKRLARNRASARLRRLRKKNLVDAYETEVGILEKTLKQLQAHEWGKDDNHKALLDALGMERGQQAIQPEQRTGIIQDILRQQTQQVQILRQSQLEQECLVMLAEDDQDELSKELQDILQLSDGQKQDLRASSNGLDTEVEALETVAASLEAMLENEWLLNEGVQGITDQFTSILHKNQLSKLLLWTDANVEAIDQLDHVQVQPLQGAPIFMFGVETTPGGDDDDGRS
jgi:hypothetical protein